MKKLKNRIIRWLGGIVPEDLDWDIRAEIMERDLMYTQDKGIAETLNMAVQRLISNQ